MGRKGMEREWNTGTFFPFLGEPEGSCNGVTLRVLTGKVFDGLNGKYSEERNEVVGGELRRVRIITDREALERERIDYLIVGWCGYTDGGQEIPCDAGHKYEAMKTDPVFAAFVTERLDRLQKLVDARAGLEQKNVLSGPSGSPRN
jgi:hypothetical protein